MTQVFDGNERAAIKEKELKLKVKRLARAGKKLKIAAIFYEQDKTSQLYTQLKQAAAGRVGLDYQIHKFSFSQPIEPVLELIKQLNQDSAVTGIIIQKPARSVWEKYAGRGESTGFNSKELGKEDKEWRQAYTAWWQLQTSQLALNKDVDGLNPQTLEMIAAGSWVDQGHVLPATCQAVIEILEQVAGSIATANLGKVLILGKSDLLGQPLYYVLKNQGIQVELLGSAEFTERTKSGRFLLDADTLVTATGRAGMITGQMVKQGVVAIDVGEPKGDLEFNSVQAKATFITPVPGGVGPMTVICLLENCLRLAGLD